MSFTLLSNLSVTPLLWLQVRIPVEASVEASVLQLDLLCDLVTPLTAVHSHGCVHDDSIKGDHM